MKVILFICAALCFSLGCQAQTKGTVKLYGYVQSVSGGKAPEIDATTGLRTGGGSGKNYRVYASSYARIYPSELWIEGVRYGISVVPVTRTPVEYEDNVDGNSTKKILVPRTTAKVIQLVPVAPDGKPVNEKAKSLSAKNNVVVVYKQGAKFYYTTLGSLSSLESGVAL